MSTSKHEPAQTQAATPLDPGLEKSLRSLVAIPSDGATVLHRGYIAALLAEVDRIRRAYTLDTADLKRRVDEQAREIERLTASAELAAEYRVPTAEKWLSVRREPNGVRWAITQTFGHSPMRVWTGELWISVALATNSELWNYDTVEAALAEARRLAEAGDPR